MTIKITLSQDHLGKARQENESCESKGKDLESQKIDSSPDDDESYQPSDQPMEPEEEILNVPDNYQEEVNLQLQQEAPNIDISPPMTQHSPINFNEPYRFDTFQPFDYQQAYFSNLFPHPGS